jgi:hypothetical protein
VEGRQVPPFFFFSLTGIIVGSISVSLRLACHFSLKYALFTLEVSLLLSFSSKWTKGLRKKMTNCKKFVIPTTFLLAYKSI